MAMRISGGLIAASFLFALVSGNLKALSEAAISGCAGAVTLTLSLLGLMCLWSGLMRAAEASGLLERLSRLLSPLLRIAFPNAARTGKGIKEIAAAVIANILGLGNAATPLSVAAMKALDDGSGEMSDDMVTFTVLGTAFPSLLPTTVLALRASSGSSNPSDILPAVWACSLVLSCVAVLSSRLLRKFV